jgi:ATP-binding cassette subfamily C protein
MANIKLNFDTAYEMSCDIIDTVHNASLLQSKMIDAAYLNQRISQDAASLIDFTISTISNIIVNILSIVLTVVLMLTISKWITFALCGFFLIYFILYIVFKKPLFKYGYEMKEQQSHYFARMFEQIHLVSFIKLHAVEKLFKRRLLQVFETYRKSMLKYQRIAFIFSSLDGITVVVMQIFLFIASGILILKGQMSAGSFIIFSSFANRLIASVSYFFSLGKTYQSTFVSYQRIQDILSWEIDLNEKHMISDNISEINIKNICFSFGDKKIINNLTLNFKRGMIYALIGKNGSGKTTFIHILVGVYKPEGGSIKYNGLSVSKLDVKYLRKNKVGIAEQEPILLHDTIYNNICLNVENPDESKLKAILEMLDLSSFIAKQPFGINTLISSKNNNISGGEKQKIAIARVLLKDPDVMIYDEPTSALDQHTTVRLIEYLNKIKETKIIIMISHDQNVIDMCENVINI